MKKLVLIAAVAFAAISCANKGEQQAQEEAAAPVEAVEVAPAEAPVEAAPAEEEQSLVERAVELGEDVAAEVEKQQNK